VYISGRTDCEDNRRVGELGSLSEVGSEGRVWTSRDRVFVRGMFPSGTNRACFVVDFPVVGLSSCTIDCRFTLWSSSASSAISIRRLRRSELVEEEVDPDAVCNEHAAERVISRSSLLVAMGNTVS